MKTEQEKEIKRLVYNIRWLSERINEIHDALCPEKQGNWQDRARQAVNAAKELKFAKREGLKMVNTNNKTQINNEGESNQNLYFDDPTCGEPLHINGYSVIEFLRQITDCVQRCPSRMDVLNCWLHCYSGRPIKGGSGIIEGIAHNTGLHHVTVLRHVQHISGHPVLGKVFKYRNSKNRIAKNRKARQ